MTDCRQVFVGPRQLRHCSSSAQNNTDLEDLKNNKDVKDILNDLYKDFGVDSHAVDEAKEKEVEVVKETKAGDADINKLLSELYGDEGDGQEEHISISGYTKFRDEDATIIYDVDEERILRRRAEEEGVDLLPSDRRPKKQDNLDKYGDIINTCGDRGVFTVTELVSVLRREKLRDVAVIAVPADRQYVDHLVLVTARNKQHIKVTAALVRKLFKMKAAHLTPPHVEGGNGGDGWVAMDLGNIALHIFNQKMREYYDI